jgi:two-component system, response regulator YesN
MYKINNDYQNMIDEIINTIRLNYDKDITLNDMAEQYHVSIGYLSKIFFQVTGTTFKKYLYLYRIQQAKSMLCIEGEKSIRKISVAVGFHDVCYFYRVFRKIVCMTPVDYLFSLQMGIHSSSIDANT